MKVSYHSGNTAPRPSCPAQGLQGSLTLREVLSTVLALGDPRGPIWTCPSAIVPRCSSWGDSWPRLAPDFPWFRSESPTSGKPLCPHKPSGTTVTRTLWSVSCHLGKLLEGGSGLAGPEGTPALVLRFCWDPPTPSVLGCHSAEPPFDAGSGGRTLDEVC